MHTVIYVEDDDMEALLFKMNMEKRGIQVLHLADLSDDGLVMLNSPEFQAARVVFIDQMVAGYTGTELAALMREWGDTRPMFLLTAGDNPDPKFLEALGMVYIQKPPDFNELVAYIKSLF